MANDGGSAFPYNSVHELLGGARRIEKQSGMSLRDWFAGMAISGTGGVGYGPAYMAERAYQIADAMLAEREKGK